MSVPVTIKYQSDYAWNGVGYVEINGTKYYASSGKGDTNLTLSIGDEIIICVSTAGSSIVVDGETVVSSELHDAVSYNITVDNTMGAIEILFEETDNIVTLVTTFTVTITKAAASKIHKTLVDNVGWAITAGRCRVDGVGYSIKKGRTLADGVGYDVAFDNGFTAENIEVGSSVFANVNGVRTEFLVVHQGRPSSMYDASCDGTWLLMKNIWEKGRYSDYANTTYSNSNAFKAVNVDFFNLLEANVQNATKTAVIPHAIYPGAGDVSSGANGLAAKAFLLSGRECGLVSTSITNDGVRLSYFSNAASDNSIRRAYLNGSADEWATRSKFTTGNDIVIFDADGVGRQMSAAGSYGYRPAFILNSETTIDPNTFDILG